MAKYVKKMGLDGVNVWAGKVLNKGFIEAFKTQGLNIYSWTINDFDKALALKAAGIDGLTTDRAEWMSTELGLIQKAKKVVIGIHGLGNKPKEYLLENWWKAAIKEGFVGTKDEHLDFEFKLVYWADLVYEHPLSLDSVGEFKLFEDYQPSERNHIEEDHSVRLKVMKFIEDQVDKIFLNDDYSLNYGSLSDVIMRRYFRDFDIYFKHENLETGIIVRDLIIQRVLKTIAHYSDREIMVVGHSMGSIIGYDILNNRLGDMTVKLFCTIGSPLGIPLVLNKIALENDKLYDTHNRLKTPSSVKGEWHNFSDPLDKVAFDYNLGDDFHPNAHGVKPIDHIVSNDYIKDGEANPHKSYGYLRTKEFSMLIRRFLIN